MHDRGAPPPALALAGRPLPCRRLGLRLSPVRAGEGSLCLCMRRARDGIVAPWRAALRRVDARPGLVPRCPRRGSPSGRRCSDKCHSPSSSVYIVPSLWSWPCPWCCFVSERCVVCVPRCESFASCAPRGKVRFVLLGDRPAPLLPSPPLPLPPPSLLLRGRRPKPAGASPFGASPPTVHEEGSSLSEAPNASLNPPSSSSSSSSSSSTKSSKLSNHPPPPRDVGVGRIRTRSRLPLPSLPSPAVLTPFSPFVGFVRRRVLRTRRSSSMDVCDGDWKLGHPGRLIMSPAVVVAAG